MIPDHHKPERILMITEVSKRTLRGYRQTCRVKIKISNKIEIARLIFAHQQSGGLNNVPIGDRVYLEPLGWFNTDDVELLEVLTWDD